MTIVSNSDIETMQKCERMFYYSRVLNGGIRPKILPVALRKGSFGHEMMEEGFKAILAGGTIEDASQAAAIPLQTLLESADSDKADLMKVYRHVITFISFTQSEKVNWRPVALEDRGMWNVSANGGPGSGIDEDELVFGFTPDIVVEFTQGLYKGQRAVLDYKFLGQYMREIEIKMAQQIPKYIIYRNKMHPEAKIRRGAFIQLNTRATPDDSGHKLFLIKWVEPNKHRLERIEYENEVLMERVARLYGETDERKFFRTVNKNVCKFCFFADLCDADFDGRPTDKMIERDFIKNDYGYNNVE